MANSQMASREWHFSTNSSVLLSNSQDLRGIMKCAECEGEAEPFGDAARPMFCADTNDTTCEDHASLKPVENRAITRFMTSNVFRCMYQDCLTVGNFSNVRIHEDNCEKMPKNGIDAFNPPNAISTYTSILKSLLCAGCDQTFRGETFIDKESGESYCGNCPAGANARHGGNRNLMLEELLSEVRFNCSICDLTTRLEEIGAHNPDQCLQTKILDHADGLPTLPPTF